MVYDRSEVVLEVHKDGVSVTLSAYVQVVHNLT